MARHDDRDTFAEALRNLTPAADTTSEELIPLSPDGLPMPAPRRISVKQARPWIRREQVPLGVRPCGSPIAWIPQAERAAFAVQLRRAEGKDCNTDGDVLLFALPHNQHAVVLDQP